MYKSALTIALSILPCIAMAASFLPLGDLPGGDFESNGRAVSADGRTVVGWGTSDAGLEAFRWTQADGMIVLGDLPGGEFESFALDVSGDGSTVVGQSASQFGPEAFRWTEGGGMTGLGDFPNGEFDSIAWSVSEDGNTVAGWGNPYVGGLEAFRWTQADSIVGLGNLTPGQNFPSGARGISGDGKVLVGFVSHNQGQEAFRWTEQGGMVGLGDLPGGSFESFARDASHDGNVVVGWGSTANGLEAFRWTPAGGMVGIGELTGGDQFSHAFGVSADGNTVFGWSDSSVAREAFIWTPGSGMQSLMDVLLDNGVPAEDLDGWLLKLVNGASADGQSIVGTGIDPLGRQQAFLANVGGSRIADISNLTDISDDAVPDVAVLSQDAEDRPRVHYYSGASRQEFGQVAYLSSMWSAVASATVADGDQDGVRNDPAVAVLGRNSSTGKLFVQTRMADGGASIAGMRFLSAAWTPVDVVIIDDVNGDGVSNDTAIGVLGINPNGSFRRRNILQVRDLAEGNVITNIYFANGSFTPLAAGTVPRSGKSPLLAVLVEKTSTKAMLVQARVLGDGSLQRNTNFLSTNWRGKDLAILQDTNGNSVFNDASYAALAHNPGNNKNVVQIRRPGGAFVKNIFVLTANWQARRMGRSEDIGGNLFEELGVLGNRFSNGEALIQLKDASTGVTLGTISP